MLCFKTSHKKHEDTHGKPPGKSKHATPGAAHHTEVCPDFRAPHDLQFVQEPKEGSRQAQTKGMQTGRLGPQGRS